MDLSKNMTNLELAELLRSVAASYQLKDPTKNKFKIIAYQRAADAIEHLSSEAKDMWDEGRLEDIPGVGKSIEAHLNEIFKTGRSVHFEKVMRGVPPATFELMKVSGIGPKTARKLTKELNIKAKKDAIEKLEKALKKGKIKDDVGLSKSIKEIKTNEKRMILPYALNIASEVIAWIKKDKSVLKVDTLGSLRRMVSTIGDIDISASTTNPTKTLDHFTKYPNSKRTIEQGEKTASILLPGEIQIDLMVTTPNLYGSLLQHFTGSKHHNIALREYALKKGFSLSEYGIKKVGSQKHKEFKTEEEFYKFLKLSYIPPELREDMGEIEAAERNKIPDLVSLNDVKGDLQIHSNFDIETSHDIGESSMDEILKKAESLNYEYVAFTEHNPSKSGHNEDQIVKLLKKKKQKINTLRSKVKAFNSLEIDVLPDGTLPVSQKGLEILDFALVSIHSRFKQEKQEMTKRILKALEHPKVKIFAHPTARKLTKRESIEADWGKIFEFCVKHNKFIEINADPMRLDLPDFLVKDAINSGVKLTLGTDAHNTKSMENMPFGVSVARKGWATKSNIINTKSVNKIEKMLK